MTNMMVYMILMMMIMTCILCKITPSVSDNSSCQKMVYQLSNLIRHHSYCENHANHKVIQSQVSSIKDHLHRLETRVNKSLESSKKPGCAIDLVSVGNEDPGFHNGLKGSLSIGEVNQPLMFFPRIPKTEPHRRGIFLVTLWKPSENCEVINSAMFDTCGSETAAISLDIYLRSVKPGSVVAGICVDECVAKLTPATSALAAMGIRFVGIGSPDSNMWHRSSAAFIATKGKPTETKMIQLTRKQGPAKLKYTIQD